MSKQTVSRLCGMPFIWAIKNYRSMLKSILEPKSAYWYSPMGKILVKNIKPTRYARGYRFVQLMLSHAYAEFRCHCGRFHCGRSKQCRNASDLSGVTRCCFNPLNWLGPVDTISPRRVWKTPFRSCNSKKYYPSRIDLRSQTKSYVGRTSMSSICFCLFRLKEFCKRTAHSHLC
jgi:hypothetical protein